MLETRSAQELERRGPPSSGHKTHRTTVTSMKSPARNRPGTKPARKSCGIELSVRKP